MSPVLRFGFVAGLAGLCLVAGCMSSKPEFQNPPTASSTKTPAPAESTSIPENQIQTTPPHPPPPASSADTMAPDILAWDSVFKEHRALPGQTNLNFTFSLTNVSVEPVVVYATETTCECTVAKLPANPWLVPPAGTGEIHATVNVTGKRGSVSNYVIVFTSKGNRMLTLKSDVPES